MAPLLRDYHKAVEGNAKRAGEQSLEEKQYPHAGNYIRL